MDTERWFEKASNTQRALHSLNNRRKFLAGIAVAGAAAGLLPGLNAWQAPDPQAPAMPRPRPGEPDPGTNLPSLPSPEKRMLDQNEKDIRKKVEQLYDLATQLKAEVDKTDSSKVLSLNLLKKAEEIEHLAHDIKNRSRG